MENEKKEPIYISAWVIIPMFFIRNRSINSNDSDLAPKYLSIQEDANSHFEYMRMLLRKEI